MGTVLISSRDPSGLTVPGAHRQPVCASRTPPAAATSSDWLVRVPVGLGSVLVG